LREIIHSFKEKLVETRGGLKGKQNQSVAENTPLHSTIKELRESVQNWERKRQQMSETSCLLNALQEIN
jgi:hypothetical protein